jgi:hypothetical protein
LARKFAKIIVPLRQQGALKAIADCLNEMGIATVRGGTWKASEFIKDVNRSGLIDSR